jgi:hypothetical protein
LDFADDCKLKLFDNFIGRKRDVGGGVLASGVFSVGLDLAARLGFGFRGMRQRRYGTTVTFRTPMRFHMVWVLGRRETVLGSLRHVGR